MHKIIREWLAALSMAMVCLPAFSAECEQRDAGGVTFSICPDREPGNVTTGNFASGKAAPEMRGGPSAPILAGQKATLAFSEINPIPAVLSDAELEKARSTKPVEANKKPIVKRKEASKKKSRAKSGKAH